MPSAPTTLTMKIEQLKTIPDRAGRYWMVLETGEKMALYRQTVEDFGLYSGRELSDAEWKKLQEHAGQMSAKMRAVRIVTASNVSKRDLERRLIQKGEDPAQAQNAVSWLSDLNVLDDARTAEQVVSSCVRKGYGIARAKQALYEKRIPKSYWDDALRDYPDQSEHILSFLRSRLDETADAKDIKRAVDGLIRRGHSYPQIRKCLQRLSLDDDDFPEG